MNITYENHQGLIITITRDGIDVPETITIENFPESF